MKVVWSKEAEEDLVSIIEDIVEEFGEFGASKFYEKILKVEKQIAENPFQFPEKDYKKVREAVIVSQTSMFYIVDQEINVIRIWINRKDRNELDL